MKEDNLIQKKSFDFAVRIVNACKFLKTNQEYDLSKQLLRSGTSIGANVEEAIGAYSRTDFGFKLSIAYKEVRETLYWIKPLHATDYLSKEMSDSLIKDAESICKIIGKIQVSLKKN